MTYDIEKLISDVESHDLSDGHGPWSVSLTDSNGIKAFWDQLCGFARIGAEIMNLPDPWDAVIVMRAGHCIRMEKNECYVLDENYCLSQQPNRHSYLCDEMVKLVAENNELKEQLKCQE